MNIGEMLIWESPNVLRLIPVVIGLVMLVRCLREGRSYGAGWLLLFGHPREKAFTLRPLAPVRRRVLNRGGDWLSPRFLSLGALLFTVVGVLLLAPEWLR